MKGYKSNREEVRYNTLTIPMSEKEKDSVRKVSESLGVSMSTFARMAIKAMLRKEGEKI